MKLTEPQERALAILRAHGRPAFMWYGHSIPDTHPKLEGPLINRQTAQALVDRGLARWTIHPERGGRMIEAGS